MKQTTTLAALLDRAAGRDSSGLALRDRGRSLSWSEAAEAAGRLAAALDLVGVGPGDRVGVHYRKSAEAFLAMHAVVQRGAIAVPLDPTASPAYLTSVAHQTGCEVVLTHQACRSSALALAARNGIRALVGLAPDDSDGADPQPIAMIGPDEIDEMPPLSPRTVDGEDPAYIITTSGSTGVPKGIGHTHDSAMAYVAFKLAAYDLRPTDRISDIAPNHFDISTLALWVTPAVGAANVVVSEPHQMLPASLSQLAADEAITVWYSVPYLLTQLLLRGDLEQRDLSALRWVLFGGEPFPPQVLGQLMARWPGARFSNVYGPAEVNACTVHHLDGPPVGGRPVPIGLPVGPARVALVPTDTILPNDGLPNDGLPNGDSGRVPVDPEQAEPEPGRQGELWVSAPTMMAGYWQRPDLDAAAIVT